MENGNFFERVTSLTDFYARLVTLFAEQAPSSVGILGDGSCFWINPNDSIVYHRWLDDRDKDNVSQWDQSAFDQHTIELGNAWLLRPIFRNRAFGNSIGGHDWYVGLDRQCDSGLPLFVDGRQISYHQTVPLAGEYAMELIARLQADGDYRLSDKPMGFLPPELNHEQLVKAQDLAKQEIVSITPAVVKITTEGSLPNLVVVGSEIGEDQIEYLLQTYIEVDALNQDGIPLRLSFDMDGQSLVAIPAPYIQEFLEKNLAETTKLRCVVETIASGQLKDPATFASNWLNEEGYYIPFGTSSTPSPKA